MKHIILASVVMSMAGVVYASEADPTALASARAKLAAMGIGVTALINKLPKISGSAAIAPSSSATSDVGWDEKALATQRGETLKVTRDIGRVSPPVLTAAMGREKPFVPKTIYVSPLPAVSESPKTSTLKLPTLVKPSTESMPPAKKTVQGIDPNAIVAKKYKQKEAKKAVAETAIVHPADTADRDATTRIDMAGTDDLDVETLLNTEVEPQVPTERQGYNMAIIQNFVGDERLYQKSDWGIYPRES